ncbi:MAG: C45 family peptidase [Bacteroidetes bacterium]|nr:C45 family peptidase [Bacteroidota bacterium]
MNIKIISYLLATAFFFQTVNIFSCTTAIISGKFTNDGRPILVKHRDASFEQNKLTYFEDGKYPYIGLVNSVDKNGDEVWGGCNEAGFAIMNSASYNLKPENDTTKEMDKEGFLMKLALQKCANIDDFEQLLMELPKPLGVEANFGVIDAAGGCAYFECDNFSYKKFDANDPITAPFGYLIRTNFSFSGAPDEGYGYIRYLTAEQLFYNAEAENNLSYKFILQDVSRCLKNSLTGISLSEQKVSEKETKFYPFEDFIVRNSSVSTILVQGVKKGESPKLSTVWTILGFQLCSVAIPTWVETGKNLPACLTENESGIAPLCDYSLRLKNKCFPIKRGSGNKYLNLPFVVNEEGTGILKKLNPMENSIIRESQKRMKEWRLLGHIPKQEAKNFYDWVDETVFNFYESVLEDN